MTALRRIALALCVILAALPAAGGATASSGSAVRNCGNAGYYQGGVWLNVTTRNADVPCWLVKRYFIPEFMRGGGDLSVPQVWWHRIGNHVPQLWRCRSYNNGLTDVRCTYRTKVVRWQIAWDD